MARNNNKPESEQTVQLALSTMKEPRIRQQQQETATNQNQRWFNWLFP
jgi:hypothetical protein